jgi:hypothetical protein
MSVKKTIKKQISLVLLLAFLITVIYPSSSQILSTNHQKSFSIHNTNHSISSTQEVEEDERTDQEIQLLAITTYSFIPAIKVSYSTGFAQQAESLFFCYLFSNITTQAP